MKDIAELLDGDMHGSAVLAKPDDGDQRRATSPSLVDYSRCRFELPEIFHEVDCGLYTCTECTQFTPAYLPHELIYRRWPQQPTSQGIQHV